mmetsp:Transcript_13550/g.26918  ORF Transcript_13550/g.26918 Transcript_13550/m.26918 type:complete len:353 (-) Transcript_13550:321-1379(-)
MYHFETILSHTLFRGETSIGQALGEQLDASIGFIQLALQLSSRLGGCKGLLSTCTSSTWSQGHSDGHRILSSKELVSRDGWGSASSVREDVFLERFALTRHNKGQRLDRVAGKLEHTRRLASHDIQTTLGHASHTLLGSGAAMFRHSKLMRSTIGHLVITDIAITLTGQIEQVGVRVVEWHDNTGSLIDSNRGQRFGQSTWIPNLELTLRLSCKSNSQQRAKAAEERHLDRLGTFVGLGNLGSNSAATGVPQTHRLILARVGKHSTVNGPGHILDELRVAGQGDAFGTLLYIPQTDGEITRARCQHIVGSWVELQQSDLTLVTAQVHQRFRHMLGQASLRDTPHLDRRIIRA